MKFKYEIEAEAGSFKDEQILDELGFVQNFDSSPYTFTHEKKEEILLLAKEIDEVSDMIWTITKREDLK